MDNMRQADDRLQPENRSRSGVLAGEARDHKTLNISSIERQASRIA